MDRDFTSGDHLHLPGRVYTNLNYLDKEYKAVKMPVEAKVSDVSK